MDQISALFAAHGPTWVSVLFILPVVLLATQLFRSSEVPVIPLIGAEYGGARRRRKAFLNNAKEIYRKGYEQFKENVFRLTTTDGKTEPTGLEAISLCALTRG